MRTASGVFAGLAMLLLGIVVLAIVVIVVGFLTAV